MLSSIYLFLNIGTPELILILGVALLLFGGNKLPELARGLGKGIREFKDASEGVKREIHNQINSFDDIKTHQEEVTAVPTASTTNPPTVVPHVGPLDQPEDIHPQEKVYQSENYPKADSAEESK